MATKTMQIPLIETLKTGNEARELAINWQHWQSEQSLSWKELADWEAFFEKVIEKFPNLKEEFKENGII